MSDFRLLKRNGNIIGLQEAIKNVSGQTIGWRDVDIRDLDEKPEKKSLAQELCKTFNDTCLPYFKITFEESMFKKEWQAVADRAVQVLLEGKEGVLTTLISGCEASHHTPKEMARAILTFLKSGGE